MVLKRKENGKLRKKLSAIIAALVLTASAGVSSFAADSDTTGTAPAAPVAEQPAGATDTANNDATSTHTSSGTVTDDNKSDSGFYAPKADLYGDILVKESGSTGDYDTEHDKVFETKAGATLDFKATLNGKDVETQYTETLDNVKKKIDSHPLAQILRVTSDKLGAKGERINITDQLNSFLELEITPDSKLIFPTEISSYKLDAEDVDANGNKRVWYYIDETKSDVTGATKKIYMQLNFTNGSAYYKKNTPNVAREGAVTIDTYDDLAPFIVGPTAKLKDLNLLINGVKVADDAQPGDYTVKSVLKGSFVSNPAVGSYTWKTLSGFIGEKAEEKIEYKWTTVQETAQNDNLDGKDNIQPASDNNPWLTVRIPEPVKPPVVPEKPVVPVNPDRPVVPVNPDRDPLQPTIPGTENEKPVTPEVKPEENTPVVPEKPEVPAQPEVKPNVPTKENSKVEKKSTVNKLPQMGVSTIAGATTAIGTVLAAASALTFKKRK